MSARRFSLAVAASAISLLAFAGVASATHSWGGYHWARTGNPFTLKIGSSVSSVWKPILATTSSDWSASDILDTVIVPGANKQPKNCRATSGRVEVCNASYGNNGWLGVAQIWASGTHITQGTVRLNDTYFNTSTYNTTAWRNLVSCQEVGHTFGLDHQDENFNNPPLGTCMDYTSDPTLNQHPNLHDYGELDLIYAHLDTVTTVAAGVPSGKGQDVDASEPKAWGKIVRETKNKHGALYENDLGKGEKVFTFVIWADQTEAQ